MEISLQGGLVRLRILRADDAELTLRWRNGARTQYLNKGAQDVDAQRRWILRSEAEGDLNFVMEYQGAAVGMISLYAINRAHRSVVMGRLLIGEAEAVGNAPVVFDAERLIMDYAFEQLNMHSICGDVVASNVAVVKMRRYLRWHQDGVIPEHFYIDGRYVDAVLVSVLKDDYYKNCRRILQAAVDLYGAAQGK
ncbi:MAG: GNAT family N-acetyltransferase [Fretibacterium sp.]|nr:GNAT family N-acetyltransferase [Fretibacterium sp.]